MKSSAKLSQDPTDWANKRKVAIERAKSLREERKNGQTDESHTFAPQINKRPSYLDSTPSSATSSASDALDNLTAGYESPSNNGSNSLFEKPLSGKVSYSIDTYSSKQLKAPLSPGSDSLGTEMRKYSPKTNENSTVEFNSLQKSQSGLTRQLSAPIRQLSQETMKGNGNGNLKNSDEEATETFLSTLRSSDKPIIRSSRPGWNDDLTSGEDILAGPPIPIRSGRPPASASSSSSSSTTTPKHKPSSSHNSYADSGIASTSTSSSSKNKIFSQKKSEWNNDFSASPDPYDVASQSSSTNTSPRATAVITQARSRLSLLKSKMRQSESSGSSKNIDYNTGGNSSDDYTSDDNNYSNHNNNMVQRESSSRSNKSQKSSYLSQYNESNNSNSQNTNYGKEGSYTTTKVNKNTSTNTNTNTNLITPPRQGRVSSVASSSLSISNNNNNNNNSYNNNPIDRYNADSQSNMTPDMVNDEYVGEQVECPDCGRKFNPSSYQKHAKICAKVFLQKRKVFDSKKMRVADNPELVKILKKVEKPNNSNAVRNNSNAVKSNNNAVAGKIGYSSPIIMTSSNSTHPSNTCGIDMNHMINSNHAANDKAKWKEQSNAFREAMKNARLVSKAMATGAPLPPPVISSPDPSLIPCPHCGRRFNAKAAERHIPKCSSIIAKPSILKKGSNHSAAAGVSSKPQQRGSRF